MNRQCTRADGRPKAAYRTFDEAMAVVTQSLRGGRNAPRTHAYRCAEHGWHIGHAMRGHA